MLLQCSSTFGLENRSAPPPASSQGSKVKSIQPALSICSCWDEAVRSLPVEGTNVRLALRTSPDGGGGLSWSSAASDVRTSGCFFTPPPPAGCKSEPPFSSKTQRQKEAAIEVVTALTCFMNF